MYQVLMLADGRGEKKLCGYWSEAKQGFILYELKYNAPGKWSKMIIGRFVDYQRMLYIAGDIAKRNAYCED